MRRIGKNSLYDVEKPLLCWGCGTFRGSVVAAFAESIILIQSRPHRHEKFRGAYIRLGWLDGLDPHHEITPYSNLNMFHVIKSIIKLASSGHNNTPYLLLMSLRQS